MGIQSAPMATNMNCGQGVIALLEAYGVDTVFGMPGVHTLDLYRGLGPSPIRHVLVRHEQGAGFMADGYARAGGRPGVCLLITGPGVTNAATAMGEAYSDSVPVLVISSVNASDDLGKGRGRLHEITSQETVTAPLTAFSKTASKPADIPGLFEEAFAAFATARPRPVHLSFPLDVLSAPAEFEVRAVATPAPSAPPQEAVAAAVAHLSKAKRPLIIAGGGCVDCPQALERFARTVGAPVVVTTAAKGVMADDHPLCLGASLSLEPVHDLLSSADLVVAVGTELAETDSWVDRLPINGKLVRIDIDAATAERDYEPTVALVGDAGAALESLSDAMSDSPPPSAFAGGDLDGVRTQFTLGLSELERTHLAVLYALRTALPTDAIVVSDMTQIAYTGNVHFPCSTPRSWFHPNGYGTLGYALPAAVGAKLAAPERPVAVLVGDGGFLFTLSELGTAVELGLPLVILLWNNDGLGQIRDEMTARGMKQIGVSPANPDYQALAKAFGCRALRPASLEELARQVSNALEADGPTLIEVRQDDAFLS